MSIPPDHSTAQSPPYPPPPDRVPLPAPQHAPPNSTPWWRRSWVIAAAAFVVGAGIAGAAASRGSSKTVAGPTVQITATATVHTTITVHTRITLTVTPTNVVAPPHATTIGAINDGTYLVGSQIQPGTYHTDGNPIPSKLCEGGVDATCGCSYTRLSNLSGDPSAIIASDLFILRPTTIQVERTDYALKLFGGCAWAKIG